MIQSSHSATNTVTIKLPGQTKYNIRFRIKKIATAIFITSNVFICYSPIIKRLLYIHTDFLFKIEPSQKPKHKK